MSEATVLKRLKMALANKEYFTDEEYELMLEDNELFADDIYDSKLMEKKLLKTKLQVLESISSNTEIMKKIEVEFVTISDAAKYLRAEIEALEKKINNMSDYEFDPDDEMNSNVGLMYSRTWI